MEQCPLCDERETIPLWRWEQEKYLSLVGRPDVSVAFVLCQKCGLARQSPFLPNEITSLLYTRLNLEARFTDFGERYRWFHRALRGSPEPGVLLDVGCSEGRQAELYLGHSWKAVGVETCPEAAERARAKGIEVLEGPIEEVDLCEESFDLILLFHLVEHIKEPRDFLQRMTACLRPNGFLYLEVPNLHRPCGDLTNFFPSFHHYVFGPDHVERMLVELGFEIIRGEAAVNQRWLARKTGRSTDVPHSSPTSIETVRQSVHRQALARTVANRVQELARKQAGELHTQVKSGDLPPAIREYISSRVQYLSDWTRAWKEEAAKNPSRALLQLIAMLYRQLDIQFLFEQSSLSPVDGPLLFQWGKVIEFIDFYRDELNRMPRQFDIREAAERMDKLIEILNTLVVD